LIPQQKLPGEALLPVTIEHNYAMTGSLFQVSSSPNSLPLNIQGHLAGQPGGQFYSSLLEFDTNPIPTDDLMEALASGTLHIQCGSDSNPVTKITTGTWLFSTTATLYSHTSQGIPSKTRRRAELMSIMAALLVHTILNPKQGQVHLSSNNKAALRDAFDLAPLRITTANLPDYDLILEIRRLRKNLTIDIHSYHSYTPNAGVPDDIPLLRTPAAECCEFLELATTPTRTRLLNCLPPSSTISVLHNKEFITSNLRRLISHHRHQAPLREKILRDYKWMEQHFNSIHWEAYYKALQKYPRSHRISITKLSYSLWNTNKQNHRYYGETALCPSC
jgi:hypothetical protein